MTKPSLAVVIPNWNGKPLLKTCLTSLQKQSVPLDVIVVDNGSTDGSVEYIKEYFPRCQQVVLDKNYGFAGGVNAGIKVALKTGYKYIVLLNNDAAVHRDWAKKLIEYAKKHPETGIITSKILHDNRKLIDTTGDFYSVWGAPFPRGRDKLDKKQYDSPEQQNIFAACGGASLYRSSMLKDVGLFDERYFAYYEDTDISFRARLAGWQVRYQPLAEVYHQIGATSSKLGDFRQYHMLKNYFYLYFKNMPGWLFWKHLPPFAVGLLGRTITLLSKGRIKLVIRAYWTILINFPSLVWARIKIQRGRKVPITDIEKLLWHKPSPEQIKRAPFRWIYRD